MWAQTVMTCGSARRSKAGQTSETWGPGLEPAQWAQGPAVGEAQNAMRRVGAEPRRIERPGSVDKEGGPGLEPVRAQGPSVGEPQDAIREAAVELRRVEGLPEPGHEFEPLAELLGEPDYVNRDLLADAIRTLDVATQGVNQLCRECDRRQQQLAVPRRVG